MKNIYLVRHGEALDDIKNTYGGWADDPLTDRGIEMAKELAKKVKELKPKKIYSSPLQRAKVTAEIVGQHLELAIEVIEDLKERNRNGVLTGMNKEEAKQKHPELVEQLKDYFNTIEGAESYEEYKSRLLPAFSKIISETEEDSLIVCHQGTFRVIMWDILKRADYLDAEHHAIIHLEIHEGQINLKNTHGIRFKNK